MADDRHSSKSRLNLRDGMVKKPSKSPVDPDIGKHCGIAGKQCATEHKTPFQKAMGEYPKFIRTFGPRQAQVLLQFKTSAIAYGLASILATMYICEWKHVLQYLPYYNGKYKPEE